MPKHQEKRAENRRTVNTENNIATDEKRSFVDWGNLDIGTLRLKCSEYSLVATGKKPALQGRLTKYFSDKRAPTEMPTTISNESIPTNGNSNETEINENANLIIAEIRALRSEVSAIKKKQVAFEQSDIMRTGNAEINKSVNNSSRNQPESAVDMTVIRNSHVPTQSTQGFQLPENTQIQENESDQLDHQDQGRPIFPQHNYSEVLINPFIPPSLKNSLLKKIERKEFVDFEELLPLAASSSSHVSPCIDVDIDTSTLKFRKNVKKEKVDNLGRWMTAWNNFMQAYLHYHPESYFDLFCYQKIFCQLASRYKFEACSLYDHDFRVSLANQVSLAPEQRTVHWGEINSEIRNLYLQDNLLPACYYCKAPGHFSTTCPVKSKETNTNSMIHHGQYNQGPPMSNHIPNGIRKSPNQVPCRRFNHSGFCAKPPCQFAHICNKCNNKGHPGIRCFNASSSNFIP